MEGKGCTITRVKELVNKNSFFRFLSSAKLAYILIFLLAIYLAYYIIIPEQQQEFTAHHSILFRILLFAIGINVIFGTIKRFVFKITQVGFILTHIGLVAIIIGASISSFVGKRGLLMIEENNQKNYYVIFKELPDKAAKEMRMPKFDKFTFPFDVKLVKFSIDYYYNSFIPSDYKSLLKISDEEGSFLYEVKMNAPLRYKGYELFQSDFSLGQGSNGANVSILSVNYDPGKNISFIGFMILSLGVINLFLLKNFWKRIENKFSANMYKVGTLESIK